MHGLKLSTWLTYSWWQCFFQIFMCFYSYLEYSFLFVQRTFHFLSTIVRLIFIDMQPVKQLMLWWRFVFCNLWELLCFDTCLMSWNDILSIELLAAAYSLSSLFFASILYYFTGLSLVFHHPRRDLIHIIMLTQPCLCLDRITLWPTKKKLKETIILNW